MRPVFSGPLFGGLLSCCATVALAQSSDDAVPSLDPVLVTASRGPQRLSVALPATSVITRQDIDDSGAPDLATLLRGQAGVDVAQSGGPGSQASVFLRGANSNQVLVLIDGLRVNVASSGAASLGQVMIDQIDHVEIVRGNVSALYGSEAIGGVIQIFTRGGAPGSNPGLGGSLTYGSEKTRAAAVDGTRAFGPEGYRTTVGLSASYRYANGFSAIDADRVRTANPDVDPYRNASVSANLSQRFGAQEVGVRYYESHGHLAFDEATDYGFIDPTYDGRVQTQFERSRQDDGQLYAKLRPSAWWTIDASIGRSRDVSANTASFPASFVIGTTTSEDRQYRFANALAVDAHAIDVGYEHRDLDGFSTSYGDGVSGHRYARHVDSGMIGYTGPLFFAPERHEFQLNGRYDDYSDFGHATTGLAAYGLKFASGWKAIVETASAFKAPSFNELYFPFFGNPALRPERAHTIETGLQYAAGASYVRASWYRTRTQDLIVYDPSVFVANNVARAKVKGVEVSARTVVDGWSLSADVTFARPIDEGTRQVLLRRARHNLRLAVAKSFGRLRVTADVEAAGRRSDTDIETFAPTGLGGYAASNFGVRYTLWRQVTVGAQVTNAFDRRYALVDGYRTAGRIAMVTLSARE